jgi:hypothetical protein
MKMKWMLAALPLFAACSHPRIMVPLEEPSAAPGKDEAKVVVYRPSFRNASKAYAFFHDEELMGFAQSGSWFEVRCAPGEHFFYLRGVSDTAVRATLQGGKTYYLKVDSEPQLLKLQLKMVPVIPGMDEFERVEEELAGLERREAVDVYVEEYEERFADKVTDRLAYFRNEGQEECAVLKAEDGR